MGAVCCCLHAEDFEEYVYLHSSIYRHCICFRCFVHQFLNAYSALFQRGEVRTISSSGQGVTPLASPRVGSTSLDNSVAETYRAPPRPLPYDIDPRCSRPQREGLISRREKASSHFHEESEPLRTSNSNVSLESVGTTGKRTDSECDESAKSFLSESPVKNNSSTKFCGTTCVFVSSEDEDVCPTCLEEYTLEDPKIMTQCLHHFHLGCIYEWMERSDTCPVCGKMMLFDETK